MEKRHEILPLTGLRFVAAFYVFIFHWHIRWPIAEGWTGNILAQGAVGMSLFFILSGFVLTHRYGPGGLGVREYFVNRLARIYPIYLVAALLTLPWIGIDFSNASPKAEIRALGQLGFVLFADFALLQAWFPEVARLWNNIASWSISVEAFFYLLFPLLLPLMLRLSRHGILCVAVASIALASLGGIAAKLFGGPSAGIFYFMPIFRLPEFVLGIALCLLGRAGVRNDQAAWLQLAAIGALLLYLAVIGRLLPYYTGHYWFALPVFGFLIFSLANGKGWLASLLATPVFVWLGRISYSFYSFQLIVLLALINHHEWFVARLPPLADNRILLALSFIVVLALSAIGYHAIEEPARRWIRRKYGGAVAA
jgi:peptidoglycan/LPS O-acetylase OafA/YrhL